MTDIALRIILSAQNTASRVISGMASDLRGLNPVLGGVAAAGLAVAGAVLGIGAVSVQMAADYQQSMLKVQALTGMTAQQAGQMSDAILQMATTVGQSPKSLADGLYFVASAGFAGADALNILQLSAEAAATGGFATKTAADALTSALNAFQVPASGARQIMDQMTATVTAGKMEWGNYANVVGKLSTIAKASGVSFGEANAALATLTNSGYSARLAGTSLGNLFTQLDLKSESLAKNFDKLHTITGKTAPYDLLGTKLKMVHGHLERVATVIHVAGRAWSETGAAFDEAAFQSMTLAQQIAYLNRITSQHGETQKQQQAELLKVLGNNATALKTYDALSGSLKQYTGNLHAISTASHGAGATTKAFAVTQQGFNFQLARAKAALDVLFITIGQQLLPVLTRLMAAVVPLITHFATWLVKSGALHAIIGILAGAVLGFVGMLERMIAIGGAIIGFFQQNELAMDALLAVLAMLGLQILSIVVPAFIAWAAAAIVSAAATLAAMWPILAAGAAVAAVIFGIILVVRHWGMIAGWLKMLWGGIVSFFKVIFQAIVVVVVIAINLMLLPWRLLFAVIMAILTPFLPFFRSIWNGIVAIFAPVVSWFGGIFSKAWGAITAVFGGAKAWFAGIWKGISADFSAVFNALGGIAQAAWNGVLGILKGGVNFFIGLINHLIDGYNDLPKFGAPNLAHIPLLAAGGIVPPGRVAIAGEAGPELIFGGTSGATVVSAQQSAVKARTMAAGGAGAGGGPIIIIHNYIDAALLTERAQYAQLAQKIAVEQARQIRSSANLQIATSGSVRS